MKYLIDEPKFSSFEFHMYCIEKEVFNKNFISGDLKIIICEYE